MGLPENTGRQEPTDHYLTQQTGHRQSLVMFLEGKKRLDKNTDTEGRRVMFSTLSRATWLMNATMFGGRCELSPSGGLRATRDYDDRPHILCIGKAPITVTKGKWWQPTRR